MDNALGEFLRARRELVTPAEVGLPPGDGRRRVPGLRREEVAMLAGISIDYYLRLERGRDRSPSARVIGALARVLHLDEESTTYLMSLAGRRARGHAGGTGEGVPAGFALLLDTVNVPGIVFDRYCDVLAANARARALSPFLQPGANILMSMFLDPRARTHYLDWESSSASAVAHLRAVCGLDENDERLHAMIGELSLKSERFRRLWARHDVHAAAGISFRMRHPRLGDLELMAEKMVVAGGAGLGAILLHAEPGSPAAAALEDLLASPSW